MYKKFYGLKENPFNLTPDPDFVFLGRIHKKALAYLTYGLDAGKGFVQLTGEIGSGKTTLLKTLLMNNRNKIKSAFIVNPKATFVQLFRMILYQFSIIEMESEYSKEVLLSKFHSFLIEQAKQNRPVVIIFDEAQHLDKSVLEEIRMLSNLETGKQKLVQMIFVGQPELREIFLLPELKQLKQRISVAFHIYPLDRDDTMAYINHRMEVAGSENGQIFTQCACEEVYSYSSGVPRLINTVCDAALLAGYVDEMKTIDGKVIKEVIDELIEDLGNNTEQNEVSSAAIL
ncbi:MAG: AAA family ATPase [Candidatus Scalindua rubra]|uniref:General secretion pathway protein A (ExeA) n=1 Tax=Candidatus Scalindua brodae TaxID=237368 RepID=A0A0B0EHR2_9BACT|nr:MAG: general secretion pathway protein A (exeA) [Candidatus Scalindua brodae]MBZ0109701.1 AAA family ATPase [Candidatus Scalindua rubra]TWU32428.1 Archaeal ATPase [Candidatus Brocadiaceae bacterium S225]